MIPSVNLCKLTTLGAPLSLSTSVTLKVSCLWTLTDFTTEIHIKLLHFFLEFSVFSPGKSVHLLQLNCYYLYENSLIIHHHLCLLPSAHTISEPSVASTTQQACAWASHEEINKQLSETMAKSNTVHVPKEHRAVHKNYKSNALA